MKIKDLILITLLFFTFVLITTDIVEYQLTGNHIYETKKDATLDIGRDNCTNLPINLREPTSDSQLKVLGEYEQACQSSFVNDMMIFTNMPISVPSAQQAADKMTIRLRQFNSQKISPIVIMEPDSEWGLVDFQEYANGDYDEWMNAYFEKLKQNGVSDSMMGLWIPFPEPQQSSWNNSSPDAFATSINRYFTKLRQYFPSTKTGILLDSQVGEANNEMQLLAYTRLIDNSLVDVAGIQGFPWYPTADGDTRKAVISASQFAPAQLAEEVAKSLGTDEILFNTGSFRHRKTENGGDIAVTSSDRNKTLDSILDEVSLLKAANYRVTVNIFAANKFDNKEGVDWSYWQDGQYKSSKQTALFTHFVKMLKSSNVEIGIYDARD